MHEPNSYNYVRQNVMMATRATKQRRVFHFSHFNLWKHAYCTYATKCVMRYKLVTNYTFGSTSMISMFAKIYGKSEISSFRQTITESNKAHLYMHAYSYNCNKRSWLLLSGVEMSKK